MNVAFIPVRGGSKSIPLKNIKIIAGKPLIYWSAKAACEAKSIDFVYVATDSEIIRNTIEKFAKEEICFDKLIIIDRSKESATDTASTEIAMLEFAEEYIFDNIILIQATSPLVRPEDIDDGFDLFKESGVDSVLSAVIQKRFNWKIDKKGYAHPTNYDIFHRPRRQEFEGYLVENGALYITSKNALEKTHNRISGNIKIVEMREESFLEIDEPKDWEKIEAILYKENKKTSDKITEKLKNIKLFLTDCDGCLTDGGMYYSENGDEIKKFNTRDGMGFQRLREKGIQTGIITGENKELNRRRAEKLKLDYYESGCKDKLEVVKKICESQKYDLQQVLYIGDDTNDIELIRSVGIGCCPKDAHPQVKNVAQIVATTYGGYGVIREMADLILNNCNNSVLN